MVLGGKGGREGEVADGVGPFGVIRRGCAKGSASADEKRTNDAPRHDGAAEEGDTDIETDEHAGSDEGRRPLKVPAPVLHINGCVLVAAPDEEPGEDVPVPKDAQRVLRDDTQYGGKGKGIAEGLDLGLGSSLAADGRVHGADGDGDGRGRGENQAQLAGDVDDEELAQGRREEVAKVAADGGQGDNLAIVFLGRVEEAELVQGGEGRDEDRRQTASSDSGGLQNGVLLGAKFAAQNGDVLEGLFEELAHSKADNGAKDVGAERPAGLETEVDVGSVDESTADGANEHSTDGQDAGLGFDVVEGDEGVLDEAILKEVCLGFRVDLDGCLVLLSQGRDDMSILRCAALLVDPEDCC